MTSLQAQGCTKRYLTMIIFIAFAVLLSTTTVLAFDFDNIKEYDSLHKKIIIKNGFGIGSIAAEYTLTSNSDYCLIDCYAEGIAKLNQDDLLFRKLQFKSDDGKTKSLNYNLQITTKEEYRDKIPEYKNTCSIDEKGNETCINEIIGWTESDVKYRDKQVDPYSPLPAGEYKWRITGKKGVNDNVDWIAGSFGKDFTEWAWWNTAWTKKQLITFNGTINQNWTQEIFVTYDSDMNASFNDIRFVNNIETTELGYRLANYTPSANATFHVRLDNNATIYMYYGNPSANTTSSFRNAYLCGDDFNDYTGIPYNITNLSGAGITSTMLVTNGVFNLTRTNGGGNGWICSNKINYQNYTIFQSGSIPLNGYGTLFRMNNSNTPLSGYQFDRNKASGNMHFYGWRLWPSVLDINLNTPGASAYNSFFTHRIDVTGNRYDYNITNATVGFLRTWSQTNATFMGTSSYIGAAFAFGAAESGATDWYYVMPMQSNMPVYSFGAEDFLPTAAALFNYPADSTIIVLSNTTFACNLSSIIQSLANVTFKIWRSNGTILYSTTDVSPNNESYNATWNLILPKDSFNWTCDANSLSLLNNRTITNANYIINGNSSNASTYDTEDQSFNMNFTYDNVSYSSISGALNYYSTSYTGSLDSSTTGTRTISRMIQIPGVTVLSNKNYWWNVTLTNSTGSFTFGSIPAIQAVNVTTFVLCNATTNTPYLNITFKDEITSATLNATVAPFTSNYYLGNGTTYKIYTLTNNTANYNYDFCYDPNSKTVSSVMTAAAASSGYPVRSWGLSANLTNATTNKTIYLLSAGDGLYQTVVVSGAGGAAVSGATVSASNGAFGIVDQRVTDANGQVQLWLNPNVAHTLTTSASGYPIDVRVINPSTTTVYISLTGASTLPANLSIGYTEGISYTILPKNSSLLNDTTYSFQFILTSSYWNVTDFGFDLYNETGKKVGHSNFTTNGGTASVNYNTANNSKMTMDAYWIANGTNIKRISKVWFVDNTGDTQYSILFFKNRLRTYINSGMFGIKTGFGLNLICFVIILLVTGLFSYKFGFNNPAIIAIFITALIGLFEFGLGFIDMGGALPLTLWAGIATVGIVFKEVFT